MSSNSMNLTNFLSSTSLFKEVDAEILSTLAEKFTSISVPARETLIQAGDAGDSLYVLEAGKLETVLKGDAGEKIVVASHYPSDSVGEIALLTGAIRSATVRTVEPSCLWQLSRHQFEQVTRKNPAMCATVEAAIIGLLQRARLRSTLYENRLFGSLEEPVLHDLEDALALISLKGGETLLHEGDPSDALYIVINGRLRIVTTNGAEVEKPLNELGSGQVVGEMGLITGEPHSATIYAIRNTLLGRLDADAFYRLLQKHPQSLTRLFSSGIISDIRSETHRAERGAERSETALRTLAVVALNPDAPLSAFAEQLTHALGKAGSALHINDTLVDHLLGSPGIAHAPPGSAADSRLALWFDEQEANQDYLIYASDSSTIQNDSESFWTKRCLQQADHVLYVAWADTEPQSIAVPEATKTQCSLILLHSANHQLPIGTQRWLDSFDFDGHHHVRWGVDEEMNRLARLLTGRGIGLVLSGGGARGFAHLGVIRALQEADIPIDLIGGTSIGAIVGGASRYGV